MKYKALMLVFIMLSINCVQKTTFIKKLYVTMGTTLEITLPKEKIQYADTVYRIFSTLDSILHPTKRTSDIYRINANAGNWTQVSPYTAECIKKSIIISHKTHGYFDITVGCVVQLWNFDREGKYRIPPLSKQKNLIKYIDYKKVMVKGDSVKIGKNQKITLSGIAKGFAVDLAVAKLEDAGVTSGIINAGGDLYCIGKRDGMPWAVGIQSPHRGKYMKKIMLSDKAIATSGNYIRYIQNQKQKFSHLINPITGEPVQNGVISVSVISDSGYLSDGLATGFFIMPVKEAIAIADSMHLGIFILTNKNMFYSKNFIKYIGKNTN